MLITANLFGKANNRVSDVADPYTICKQFNVMDTV